MKNGIFEDINNDLNHSNNSLKTLPQLHKISLPLFCVKIVEFSEIEKNNNVLIAKNEILTNDLKLFYLRRLIEICEDIFESLFKALAEQVENKGAVIEIHI